MLEFDVTYIAKQQAVGGKMRIDSTGVGLLFGRKNSGHYSWSEVQRISFDDPGRTKARVGAVVAFGVFGLAARKAFTLLTLSVTDEDMFFELQGPLATWRATAARIQQDVPESVGKICVDGEGGVAAVAADGDIIDQIRRLGELRDSGLITPEEFETKKAELLGRL